ncbi:hypothetical protein IW261DRAFT_1612439 [Armillaria novae-zelandiae]|uniref:NB-ARC domain-containing protein n=1 Tax=Armillaria novae-zelandiae TaxID=153914 RepID=A0AA39NNC6_9AGAR|nr:hypothetical protein IW261DRAFT_1517608 [Armillaria novae-zelandiae]KAK0470869.1 hypothetical protein IW261DRAFT_1612439 [Armillaria novae-zelandiae]
MSLILRQNYDSSQHNGFLDYLRYLPRVLDSFSSTENATMTLSARPTIFGRDDCIMEFVRRIMDGSTKAAAVRGSPFIGKTSIAREIFFHQSILDRFDNHRYWVSCTNITSLEKFLDVFIQCLGQQSLLGRFLLRNPFAVLSMKRQTIVDMLAQANVPQLVVLDGFEGVWDNTELRDRANQILSDIHNIPDVTLLFTLRGTTVPSVVDWTYQLGPLPTQGARLLFLSMNHNHSGTELDDLLQKVDFNPTLVGVLARMGNELNMRPVDMLQEWDDRGIELLENFPDEMREFQSSVESSLKGIMESNTTAWKLLKILSMFPQGLPQTELHRIAPDINHTIATELPMLDPNPHLLRLHAPIRSYIFQFHPLDDSISNVYSYVFEECKKRVSRPGDGEFIKNTAYLTSFGSNIEFVITDALDRGCIDAIEAFLDYSALLSSNRPNERIMKKATALARQSERKELLARCLLCLAEMERAITGTARGAYTEPVAKFMELNDIRSAAYCEYYWALSTFRSGDDGGERLVKALEMFRTVGDEQGQAQCFLSLFQVSEGHSYDYHYLHTAKAMFTKLDDQFRVAQCLKEEAGYLLRQNKIKEALTLLFDAADKFTRFEDGSLTAGCLHRLGTLLHALGDEESCYDLLDRAMNKYQSLGRKLDAAFCMKDLATRYWTSGRFPEAISLQETAVPIFWSVDFVYGGAETRLELGMSQIAAGRIDDAILSLEISKRENQRNEIQLAVQISTAFLRLCQEAQSDAARLELQRIAREQLSTMTSWVCADPLLPYLDVEAVNHLRKFS